MLLLSGLFVCLFVCRGVWLVGCLLISCSSLQLCVNFIKTLAVINRGVVSATFPHFKRKSFILSKLDPFSALFSGMIFFLLQPDCRLVCPQKSQHFFCFIELPEKPINA